MARVKGERFLITIDKEMLDDIRILADEKNKSISGVITEYCEEGLKKDKKILANLKTSN